jgi:hypothetical protein
MRLEQTRATLASRVIQRVPLALTGLVRVMGAVACLYGQGHTPLEA